MGDIAPRGTVKRSITLQRATLESVETLVGKGEVSRFIDEAVAARLRTVHLDAFLEELDDAHGPVSAADLDASAREVDALDLRSPHAESA